MSYTRYPAEASSFASKANSLRNKINNNISCLDSANGILSSCSNDLIVTRSCESITNVTNRIKKMNSAISSDISTVNKIAQELENEARLKAMREKAKKELKEG